MKFHEGDLIGIPLRVTIGARGIRDGVAELKGRRDDEPRRVALAELESEIMRWLDAAKSA